MRTPTRLGLSVEKRGVYFHTQFQSSSRVRSVRLSLNFNPTKKEKKIHLSQQRQKDENLHSSSHLLFTNIFRLLHVSSKSKESLQS
jgi:hypothetical protein